MDDSEVDKNSGEFTSDESFEKMARPQTIWNITLSFCIKIR